MMAEEAVVWEAPVVERLRDQLSPAGWDTCFVIANYKSCQSTRIEQKLHYYLLRPSNFQLAFRR